MPFSIPDYMLEGPDLQSAINVNLFDGVVNSWTDVSQFSAAFIQLIGSAGIASGAVTIEQTNDPVGAATGVVCANILTNSSTGAESISAITVAASTQLIYQVRITAKWMRVRISTVFAGGTLRASTLLSQNGQKAFPRVLVAPATLTSHYLTSAASTNATSVKTSAAVLGNLILTNLSATVAFFKLYNKASAPTVGTDIPIATIEVAALSARQLEFGPMGQGFTTGLAYAITNLQPDADATAIAAGAVKVALQYT